MRGSNLLLIAFLVAFVHAFSQSASPQKFAVAPILEGYGPPITLPDGASQEEVIRAIKKANAAKVHGAETAVPNEKKPGEKPNEKKPGEKKDDEKKPDEKKEGNSEEKPAGPVKRPEEPPEPPDPEELKVRLDDDGKVRFNFTGQPWPDVLQWLADVSKMSLDWQELPGGYLNLTTTESYTVPEARDLINRHLLAREYTLLRHGEVLSVVKLEKLNPVMVPRVEPKDLDTRDPHEFIRVSFTLDWLLAHSTVEELKPMLGPHGKLNALSTTNRLEAIDTVVNLLEIRRVLSEEQSNLGQDRLIREFVLKHTRADDIQGQLLDLLGMQRKSNTPSAMTPQKMQQMQQQMQQMQRMAQQNAAKKAAVPRKPGEVHLVVNQRKNSILVHAPPDKMAIIEQAVEVLDVAVSDGEPLMGTVNRMKTYRLMALDPAPLVKTLEELGGLSPLSRLTVDQSNRAIIAYAPLADHVTIQAVIDKLDATGRRFEVVPLRRLEADYVAGTIEFMMGSTEKKDSTPQIYGYSPFSSYNRTHSQKKNTDEFRVDADVEYNRLLLWANDVEIEEVKNLLTKLGEIPPEGGDLRTIRVIDTYGKEQVDALLERVRKAWPNIAPNPLVLPKNTSAKTLPESAPIEKTTPKSTPEATTRVPPPAAKETIKAITPMVRFASMQVPQPTDPKTSQTTPNPDTPPPITITRSKEGKLVLSCDDPRALDLLEGLMDELAPPRQDYKVFRLKYAWAYGVALNLKDFFKEDDEKDSRRSHHFWGYDPYRSNQKNETRSKLSKRRELKFISDSDTNSILVQNADPQQMATIEELIEYYDQPEPTDSQSVRKTQIFHLRYTKAAVVAATIKDVYRDLLSANDKALAAQQKQRSERTHYVMFDEDEEGKKAPRFKGLLSIGVDELSNTMIVSAPSYLLDDVTMIIEDLDESAKPIAEAVRVVHLSEGVNVAELRDKLSRILKKGNGGKDAKSKKPNPHPGQLQPSGIHQRMGIGQ